MSQEFNFKKRGLDFMFRNPRLSGTALVCEYKILGIKENENENEGYFYNSELIESKKMMQFGIKVEIDGIKFDGVGLPDEIYAALKQIKDKLTEERDNAIERIINEILEGKRLIDFGIVGCDFPHYQPWLQDLPEELDGLEQHIMERAVVRYTGKKYLSQNVCEYLEKILKQRIATEEEMNPKAVNIEYNEKTQKYHGYNDTVITGFQMKLSDIIPEAYLEEMKKKKAAEEKAAAEKEERRKALQVEILDKGKTPGEGGADYYAVVKITDPVTKESLRFNCRNIFDFGYVINPDYAVADGLGKGGLAVKGKWQTLINGKGWEDVREQTEFEKKCLEYLNEFSPVSTDIRM